MKRKRPAFVILCLMLLAILLTLLFIPLPGEHLVLASFLDEPYADAQTTLLQDALLDAGLIKGLTAYHEKTEFLSTAPHRGQLVLRRAIVQDYAPLLLHSKTQGRLFWPGDHDSPQYVLLSSRAAWQAYGALDSPGKQVKLGENNVQVLGVVDDHSTVLQAEDVSLVYLAHDGKEAVNTLAVMTTKPRNNAEVARMTRQFLIRLGFSEVKLTDGAFLSQRVRFFALLGMMVIAVTLCKPTWKRWAQGGKRAFRMGLEAISQQGATTTLKEVLPHLVRGLMVYVAKISLLVLAVVLFASFFPRPLITPPDDIKVSTLLGHIGEMLRHLFWVGTASKQQSIFTKLLLMILACVSLALASIKAFSWRTASHKGETNAQ